MTGIASGRVLGLDTARAAEVVKEENARAASLFGINPAARTTCVKPAGTTSLALGTSSGIHAWHDEYYIRRIRVGKNEAIYSYLAEFHPELVEDEFFRPHDTAVISAPQKAPEGSILRTETAHDLLERIKLISSTWVRTGHRKGENTHNVSATVSIKEDEWDSVRDWMWANRDYYNGLSVLPADGGTYKQAPFESCTREHYEEMLKHLASVDLRNVFETADETNLTDQAACAGGACTLV
jgi:ribonucleoside-triphosphate reductase